MVMLIVLVLAGTANIGILALLITCCCCSKNSAQANVPKGKQPNPARDQGFNSVKRDSPKTSDRREEPQIVSTDPKEVSTVSMQRE